MKPSEYDLIGHLYDAALGRMCWAEVSRQLIELLGGMSLQLAVQPAYDRPIELIANQTTDLLMLEGISREYMQGYVDYYAQHDLWTTETYRRRLFDRPLFGTDIVSARTWEDSEIYNDFARPYSDVFQLLGAVLRLPNGKIAGFGVHRARRAPLFTELDRNRLASLLPHLSRSLDLRGRLGKQLESERSLLRVLDHLPHGVLILKSDGAIIHANAIAQQILAAADGLTWTSTGLRAAAGPDDTRLQNHIRAATAVTSSAKSVTSDGYVRIARPSGRRSYVVFIAPIGTDRLVLTHSSPTAIVFITEPGAKYRLSERALKELFGMTTGEARVAIGLASGQSVETIAAQAGTKLTTVRTLLGRSMNKTESRSQAQLVETVMSIVISALKT